MSQSGFGVIESVDFLPTGGWIGLQIAFVNLKPEDYAAIRASIHEVLPKELADICANFLPREHIPPVRVLISNYQSCCEDFGFLVKPSLEHSRAIGTDAEKKEYGVSGLLLTDRTPVDKDELKALADSFVRKALVSADWGRSYSKDQGWLYQNTAEVVLQLEDGKTFGVLLWNDHNGYYSHSVRLEKHGRADEQDL